LGAYLKRTGIMLGAGVLERSIRVLSYLDGPTLADGPVEPGTPNFAIDVFTRGNIAACLLHAPRQVQRLQACLSQFRQACDSDIKPEATALAELFRRVKITKSLKAQFQQLRCPAARKSSKLGA